MARSVFIGIVSASFALALTAAAVTPSMAMSFNEYDASSAPLGSRAQTSDLFSGRLLASQHRKAREFKQLQNIRRDRGNGDGVRGLPAAQPSRPLSELLPFLN